MRNPLTGVEWITLWYALINEVGNACDACLINEVITEYYTRLTDNQCSLLVGEMKGRWTGMANPMWEKLIAALDRGSHTQVDVDGKKATVFKSGDRLYPLKDYIARPHEEIYIEDLNKEIA